MNLFFNTSNLQQQFQDCCALDVGETIERDCLSVLHKLHDQVNGLQLVQVVVQPLAKLFNPTSLAALVANVSNNPANNPATIPSTPTSTPTGAGSSISQAITNLHHNIASDLDGLSTQATLISSSQNTHSRSQSLASTHTDGKNATATNNSLLSSTSTYMMSPDTAQALIARLDTDRDVNWLMEIIGYGLSMPFSLTGEQDSVKDCCTIYCEWLASSLLPYNEHNEDKKYQQLSKLVPDPIRNEPNRYARKMFSHLYNVFLPRPNISITGGLSSGNVGKDQSDSNLTAVSRQAVLCHRVLRTIESIAQNQMNLMDDETWNHLLALLLTVNDKLLSCPTEPDDIGTQLHDRILGVLFDVVLLASAKSLPTPNLWKTFHEMCLGWRHRPALIDHWKRITLTLTKRVMSTPNLAMRCTNIGSNLDNSSHSSTMNAIEQAVQSMSHENLSQAWYRFLNLIGNPVELSNPNAISRTEEFYHSACMSDNVLDPRQHPCLNILPQVFLNSIVGLKELIESFLGFYQNIPHDQATPSDLTPLHNPSSRGSIISLTNTISSSFQPSTPLSSHPSNASHHIYQPTSQVQQVQTPTQSRRAVIKPIKGNKVIPFNNLTVNQSNDTSSSQITADISKLKSQQLMHPRPSLTSLSSRTSNPIQQQNLHPQFKLYPDRPKCNSVLHIFGDWLFGAALLGSELNHENSDGTNDQSLSETTTSYSSTSTATEVSGNRGTSPSLVRKFSSPGLTLGSKSNSTVKQNIFGSKPEEASDKITLDQPLTVDSFEAGQAEAMAILCRIFSSKSSSEDVAPHYLSRFYLCLQHCLRFGSGQEGNQTTGSIKRQLLASVLMNSTSLLQRDLDGINLLIPAFIKAIEFVFECGDREVPIQPPPRQHNRTGSIRQNQANALSGLTNYDLKRSCILTLLNLLAYPFHFKDLGIRNCLNESSPTTTFGSLRPRLLKLLFVALQTETDPINMQILFGGLSLSIHDLAFNPDQSITTNTLRSDSSKIRKKGNSATSQETTHESGNSSFEDDSASQNSFVFDSKGGFIIKSLHVTCHLLLNIWKHDTQVSLAALELLTTIARISTMSNLDDDEIGSTKIMASRRVKNNINNNNNNNFDSSIEMRNEYRQTTKWICDYICNQCSRPPPAHSRDMHSTIVAAYQCLSVWFFNHPYLLSEQDCVSTLMEVIELGVSGQKSKIGGQPVVLKGDKVMKPSSMRVRDAAESLLNICMVRSRTGDEECEQIMSSFDTVLDEPTLANMFVVGQHKSSSSLRQVRDGETRNMEVYKMFKYYTDDDSVIFSLLNGPSHDSSLKDSVICLLRTPFGKHCWKMRFNYYTDKSRDKIIANKTQGLIKRPFSQCGTPSSETGKLFPFPARQNKSLYFNNSARFFPNTLDSIPPNELDKLVTTLEEYAGGSQNLGSKLKGDLEKIGKLFNHQVLAEQKVLADCGIKTRLLDCQEPQPSGELEAARVLTTHLGLQSSLNVLSSAEKVSASLINDLKSLDQQPVRVCDLVSIFYIRKNRTSPKEVLESVRERHNVSLSFFEWILELGEPLAVKSHSRWTGKRSSSWLCKSGAQTDPQSGRTQMLLSDHGGSIFDGDRMTLYWSDMCQELAFLVPHKIDSSHRKSTTTPNTATPTGYKALNNELVESAPIGSELAHENQSPQSQQAGSIADNQGSDAQSICSVTSDTSSQSARTTSHHGSCNHNRDQLSSSSRDNRDAGSLSRQSIAATSKRRNKNSPLVGCDTNIMICWLECADDIQHIPNDSLAAVCEQGYLLDEDSDQHQTMSKNMPHNKDYVRYMISPMKNGLYRVNLVTSFGRHWLALPLVDGITVTRSLMSSLVRESILNLCRRRRLDVDSYQPPHVRRRLKIQEICDNHRILSRLDPIEFYHNTFRSK